MSPATYQFAKALYAVTNRRAEERLPGVKAELHAALEQGRVPHREHQWLAAIIAQAEEGEWKAANRACRQMMEDQVE